MAVNPGSTCGYRNAAVLRLLARAFGGQLTAPLPADGHGKASIAPQIFGKRGHFGRWVVRGRGRRRGPGIFDVGGYFRLERESLHFRGYPSRVEDKRLSRPP